MTEAKPKLLVVAGATGTGKSALAMRLAERLSGEIISCDSVQVYRRFDIGSAKPSAEDRRKIPHHLIDVVDADADFDAAVYAKAASAVAREIRSRGRLPIVCGGTGLYLRALLKDGFHLELPSDANLRAQLQALDTQMIAQRLQLLDPERAQELHANDRVRLLRSLELVLLLGKSFKSAGLTATRARAVDAGTKLILLHPPRALLHLRIEERTQAMLAKGLVTEVKTLLESGISRQCKPMQSIGYKQVATFLAGELIERDLLPKIVAATRQYAKRQITWFRQVPVTWQLESPGEAINSDLLETLTEQIKNWSVRS